MTEFVTKVSAYITYRGNLLIISEPVFPEAGIQVPSGTVEAGEDLANAVLREAAEGTGLTALNIISYLGKKAYDSRFASGQARPVQRHFFQLE